MYTDLVETPSEVDGPEPFQSVTKCTKSVPTFSRLWAARRYLARASTISSRRVGRSAAPASTPALAEEPSQRLFSVRAAFNVFNNLGEAAFARQKIRMVQQIEFGDSSETARAGGGSSP